MNVCCRFLDIGQVSQPHNASSITLPNINPQAAVVKVTSKFCFVEGDNGTCNKELFLETSTQHLEQHKLRANAKGKFKCPWTGCTKTLVRRQKLLLHLHSHLHDSVRGKFVCKKCSKKYCRMYDLQRHQKAKHLN
ncbi:hypothetical protein GYMLUDRAFT_939006 [Collybiopsis luxurians FD-317 M1]|uniref:C2H2-type domain-containing protein n=1 Tax=Collybiopsis luxurians FD-317 M1 TaxID=944289 RepID=A0A0D0BFF4_9AGAR|nr:hypothetical protein GYMLUDRAFT_939006 [Collybiopsis luxurians FD-317 M1]